MELVPGTPLYRGWAWYKQESLPAVLFRDTSASRHGRWGGTAGALFLCQTVDHARLYARKFAPHAVGTYETEAPLSLLDLRTEDVLLKAVKPIPTAKLPVGFQHDTEDTVRMFAGSRDTQTMLEPLCCLAAEFHGKDGFVRTVWADSARLDEVCVCGAGQRKVRLVKHEPC